MLYGLYDTRNNGLCVGLMSAKEISVKFKTSIDSFYCAVARGVLLKARYEVVKFNEVDLDQEESEV